MKEIIRIILAAFLMQLTMIPPITAKSSTLRGLCGGAASGALFGGLLAGRPGALYGTLGGGILGTLVGAHKDSQRKKNRAQSFNKTADQYGTRCQNCFHSHQALALPNNEESR